MPGTTLSATDIMTRFNTIVRANAIQISSATWYAGNFPSASSAKLGARSEVTHSASELAASGYLAATVVFNILHGFAMELTRVRRVQAWHRTDAAPINGGAAITALNSNYAAYFPIPYQPIIGDPVTDAELVTFLGLLRNAVNNIRSSSAYEIDVVTCHTSCHSSCHSSRSRR